MNTDSISNQRFVTLRIQSLLFFFLFTRVVFSQNINLEFASLTTEQGLSQNAINSIQQDQQGFMWFGTMDGLNRYDGYNFKTFNHVPHDKNSLSDNYINKIFSDSKGNLWIGTRNGLNKYDPAKGTFEVFIHDDKNQNSISANSIWAISEDHFGNIWIGTDGGGMDQIIVADEKNKSGKPAYRFLHYRHEAGNEHSLSHNTVFEITFDHLGNGWVGTENGMLKIPYDQSNPEITHKKFERIMLLPDQNERIDFIKEDSSQNLWIGASKALYLLISTQRDKPLTSKSFRSIAFDDLKVHNKAFDLIIDEDKNIWIATEGGLVKLIPQDGSYKVESFRHNENNPKSLHNNYAVCLYYDRSGIIWVGTISGISYYQKKNESFNRSILQTMMNDTTNGAFTSFHEDKRGNFWITTEPFGLVFLNPNEKKRNFYRNDPDKPNSISNNVITAFLEDSQNNYWIATYDKLNFIDAGQLREYRTGKTRYPPENISFRVFDFNPRDSNSIQSKVVLSLGADASGRVWVGTGRGLSVYDAEKKSFHRINLPGDTESLFSRKIIRCIYRDHLNKMWIGTDGGLFRFDPFTLNCEAAYVTSIDDPSSISHNRISYIYEDSQHKLWIGTNGGGLNLFEREKNIFQIFNTNDGLPNNVINSIIEDDHHNLWIGSNKGLARFSPASKNIIAYDTRDGLKDNEFSKGAVLKCKSGEFLFGNMKGFNSFFPDKIILNTYIPPVVITDFKIFDQSILNGKDLKLKSLFTNENAVALNSKENHFSFEFAALNFINPEKNQYQYKLEGYDKNWVQSGTRRYVSYTNLDPGGYTFKVKGSNNDGVWNEKGISVAVSIQPPYYRTWWFRIMAACLMAFLIFFVTQMRIHAIREKKEREVAERSGQLKQQFLANMSHEIRTPLNAIVGMTRLILEKHPKEEHIRYLNAIRQSSDNLLVIVNDILDFSKIEAGKLELESIPFSIAELLNDLCNMLHFKIEEKNLLLKCDIDPSVPKAVTGDPVRLNEVLFNLAGNAVKFTEKGSIIIHVKKAEADQWDFIHQQLKNSKTKTLPQAGIHSQPEICPLIFSVIDTGIGIPEDKLETIFESFSQAKSDTTRKFGGTGLGLTISKQLVELHYGKIWVSSELGTGTTFSFLIPYPLADEKLLEKKKILPEKVKYENLQLLKVLLVEDNEFNRIVAVDTLLNHIPGIEVYTAVNGKAALDMLSENFYDLVLMDIQMPEMDGYEATYKIRNEFPPPKNSIRIIAMTAGVLKSEVQKCFETGMDDYIAKPFNPPDLFEKMNKLFPDTSKISTNAS
jgi:signal transduction histidine kinase/ligand-binding sensor domain-containing protein/ActR/RegA family two-component response regulator